MAKTCSIDHGGGKMPAAFNNLPESQAGVGRHKCPACAYELGRTEATAAEERLRVRVRELQAEVAALRKGAAPPTS